MLAAVAYGYYPKYKENLKWYQYVKRMSMGNPKPFVLKYFFNIKNNSQLTVLDWGAGNRSDTNFLLRKGYIVYAVDVHDKFIKRINKNITLEYKVNLHLIK